MKDEPTSPPPAFWDAVAERTWGSYITGAEEAALDQAQAQVAGPRHGMDVGCGGGRWTRLLLDRGWSMTGLDVDPQVRGAFTERNPGAEFLLVPVSNRTLPAPDRSQSLVVCIEVHPVAHSDWFMAEARRVLVPGGRLVVVAWNRRSLRGLATDALSRIRTGSPHRFYQQSYVAWRRQLRAAGFGVSAEQGICWLPFGRRSDSPLVPTAVAVERFLRLGRLPALSPWVLVTAVRDDGDGPGAGSHDA